MKTLIILFILAFSAIGHTMPQKVILIRHGEEPKGDEGRELSKRGWQRAAGLSKLFSHEGITHLIALKPHRKKGSIRSIQTLAPLSQELGIDISTPFDRDEVAELVGMLSNNREYDGKIILIAWQHETLAQIAHGFGAHSAPEEWGDDIFDRYWVLQFRNNGTVGSFENLPQRLLKKDSKR